MSNIATKRKTTLTPKQILLIFLMGFGYTVVFTPPFIQFVIYDPLLEGLQCTNAQLGTLAMIYGVGNLISPFGGALSDRFNTKAVYLVGMIGMCVLDVVFALTMSYNSALFIWAGYAIFALFLVYPAHTKLTRLIGSENQQGTIFGFTESFCGITNVIVNSIVLFVFAKFATDAYGVRGLKAAITCYAILGLLCAVLIFLIVPKPTNESEQKVEGEKITVKDWISIMTSPRTWFAGIAGFCVYCLFCALSYFTPYFSNVLGVSVVFTGGLSIIRQYGARFVGAPIGGWLGDKLHSLSGVVGIALGCAGIIVFLFMVLPSGTNATLLIVLTLLVAILTFIARGPMFAIPAELEIPRRLAGSTSGLVCAIGFCPDLFIFTLFGNWLDKYGNGGYEKIFIYTVVVMVIGVINAIATLIYKKKHGIGAQKV